jgi:hypothetical protein
MVGPSAALRRSQDQLLGYCSPQLTDKFSAAGSQASNDTVDVLAGECEVADTRRVRRRVPVVALVRRRVELDELESSVAVRRLHHRIRHPYAFEPHNAIHPATIDGPLATRLKSELDEELNRGREVVNHNAHVVHSLDSHVFSLG